MTAQDTQIPRDLMQLYAGVIEYDWAARLIDPKAHAKFDDGDGFDRIQYAQRLMLSRHIAKTIVDTERQSKGDESLWRFWSEKARQLAADLDAERQRDQWQPIDENTPHHQNVLVWREDAGEPWVAQYTDETFFDAEAGDSDRMDWFDLAGRYEGIEAPTHWQPLPVGPKGGEA